MSKNNHYAILMAGGVGSRFWPVSTSSFPKQFHDMLGSGQTLIQKTFSRLLQTIPAENIYILTNERYKDLVQEQLPLVKDHQVLLEPVAKNTAPCILYASLKIQKTNPDALVLVAPSDHWIEDEASFSEDVIRCFEACKKEDILMTMGIKPTFPNTGYGYIRYEKTEDRIKKVSRFTEKPDYETARTFLSEGNYLWNAGIFVWSIKSITEAFEKFQPVLFDQFKEGISAYNTPGEVGFIQERFPKVESISIDYAIMEHSENIYVLPASFDWNDLGTWGSLYNELDKDDENNAVVNARHLLTNASGNMIRTAPEKVVVLDGLNDYIVVDHDQVLLIYPKEKEQQVKEVMNTVVKKFGNNLA